MVIRPQPGWPFLRHRHTWKQAQTTFSGMPCPIRTARGSEPDQGGRRASTFPHHGFWYRTRKQARIVTPATWNLPEGEGEARGKEVEKEASDPRSGERCSDREGGVCCAWIERRRAEAGNAEAP